MIKRQLEKQQKAADLKNVEIKSFQSGVFDKEMGIDLHKFKEELILPPDDLENIVRP